jgi:hypothetical protein
MQRAPASTIVLALMVSACRPGSDARQDGDSTQVASPSAAAHPDSVPACFMANASVLARTQGNAGVPDTGVTGWIRLDHFRKDSASAKLIDSDGFALDAVWLRKPDSLIVSGFNDFVRIEMRLGVDDSVARGTLRAHSDAALERDAKGKLREFRRESTISFRQSPCDSMPKQAGTAEIDVLPHGTPRPGIRFDPEKVKRGTSVGALVVDSLFKQFAIVDSTWVGTARFRNEIELSGWTLRNPDPDLYRQLTCFEADSSSAARLPRWEGDERRAWFCFSNRLEAARALGPPSEGVPATIVIDQFTIHRGHSDEVNSARFVRLVRRGGST